MNQLLIVSGFIAKSCLICIAAIIVCHLLNRFSARFRHAILVAAMVALLVPVTQLFVVNWSIDLPVVSALAVEIDNNSQPGDLAKPVQTRGYDVAETNETIANHDYLAHQPPQLEQTAQHFQALHSGQESIVIAGSSLESREPFAMSWLYIAVWIWVAGTCFSWLRIGFAAYRLNKLQSSNVSNSSLLWDILRNCKSLLKCKRRIKLQLINKNLMPMVAGVFSPTVYMPVNILQWKQERIETALLHELAHIVRQDCLVNWFSHLIAGMYWWNPLVWHLRSQIEIEREKACDEKVVALTADPTAYAENLVSIVRESTEACFFTSIAMARKSLLSSRIQNILLLPSTMVRESLFQIAAGRSALILFLTAAVPLGLTKLTTFTSASPATASEITVDSDAADETAGSQDKSAAILDRDKTKQKWIEKYKLSEASLMNLERQGKTEWKMLSGRGTVTTESGQPISDALVQLRLRHSLFYRPDYKHQLVVCETRTNAKGEFQFVDQLSPPMFDVPSQLDDSKPMALLVTAENYGYAVEDFDHNNKLKRYNFKLKTDVRFGGTVSDNAGTPIANCALILRNVCPKTAYESADLRKQALTLGSEETLFHTSTDQNGKFVIRGMPAGVRIAFTTVHDDFADKQLTYLTNSTTPVPPLKSYDGQKEIWIDIPRDNVNLRLKRGKKIVGQIVYDDTGKPASGLKGVLFVDRSIFDRERFETDNEGRFSTNRFEANRVAVMISQPENSPYIRAYKLMTFPADAKNEQPLMLRLKIGQKIVGTLKSSNGRPVQDATVGFYAGLYEFPPYLMRSYQCKTDEDGKFEMYVAPGKGEIIPSGYSAGCVLPSSRMVSMRRTGRLPNLVKEKIVVVEGEQQPPLSLVAPASIKFASRVVDSDGNPLIDAEVSLVRGDRMLGGRDAYQNLTQVFSTRKTDEEGRFLFDGVPHDCEAAFMITHAATNRAAVLKINKDKDVKPEIVLPQCSIVEGIVLKNDKPIEGIPVDIKLALNSVPTGANGSLVTTFKFGTKTTNKSGRYKFLIPPNHEISVYASLPDNDSRYHIHKEIPQPGTTVEIPEFKFLSLTESINGVVVDSRGNPVANARVIVQPRDPYIPGEVYQSYDKALKDRGNRPFETGEDGKFQIPFLPVKKPVRVFVWLTDENGKRTTSSNAIATTGDTDVKVILDTN